MRNWPHPGFDTSQSGSIRRRATAGGLLADRPALHYAIAMPTRQTTTQNTTVPQLPSLDLGRFVAALLVALFHMGITVDHFRGQSPIDGLYRGGHAGVNYFFVLSGFIIMHVHRADLGRPRRLAAFARKRVIRIVPLLWFTMIGWGLVRLFLPGGTGGALRPSSIVLDCLLLPHDGESVIGAIWTLRREVVFYLLFAVMIVDRRAGLAALLAWQGAIVANTVHPFFFWGPEPEMVLGVQNLGFGAGMALAMLVRRHALPAPRLLIAVGAGVFAATMIAEWLYGDPARPEDIGLPVTADALLYLAGSTLVVAGMAAADLARPRPRGRMTAILGDSSYALYLTQGPVGSIAIRLFRPLWPVLSAEALLLLLTITVILAAIAINRWIERPIVRWLRGTGGGRGARIGGPAAGLDTGPRP